MFRIMGGLEIASNAVIVSVSASLLNLQTTLMLKRCAMVIDETTVRPMDEAVEHPRTDWLRVGE
ncbi:hypothetical protein FAP94_05190 [Morganella morganii]|nr:hypothetical protein [Morganella morganii]